nr:MAG TPA: hypothetical protein [Caudoviricetes sp.]
MSDIPVQHYYDLTPVSLPIRHVGVGFCSYNRIVFTILPFCSHIPFLTFSDMEKLHRF